MRNLIEKIKSLPDGRFITGFSFFVYLALWYFSPDNKQILAIFILALLVLFWKTGSFAFSLLLTYLLSSVIFVGKTQEYQLLSFVNFPAIHRLYPNGYGITVLITAADIFSFLMLLFSIKNVNLILKRRLSHFDGLLIALFFWSVIANIFASKNIYLSLYIVIKTFQLIILNFYIKFFILPNKLKYLIAALTVIVFFQTFTALQQFINHSPLGKSIEMSFNPSLFGGTVDEFYFTSRPIGTFDHANNLAIYIASLVPLFLSLFLISSNFFFQLLLLLEFAIVFLTLSRTAWIGLFFSLLIYLYLIEHRLKINLKKYFSKKFFFGFLAILPLTVYALPRIAKTLYSFEESGGGYLRIKQTEEVFKLIMSHPLFGVGTGMTVVEAINRIRQSVFLSFPQPIHNFYLLIAAEIGLIGLLIFSLIIFLQISSFVRENQKTKNLNQKIFNYSLFCSSLIIILAGFFQPFMYLTLLIVFYHLRHVKIDNPIDYVR